MNADLDYVVRLLDVEMRDPSSVQAFIFDGEPKSKARPRFGKRGHVFDPSKPHEDALIDRLLIAWRGTPKYEGNVAMACVFYRSNYQRIDVDNMTKLVMDAATRTERIWDDDCQVTYQVGVVEYDPDRPRTVVAFSDARSSMPRGVEAFRRWCIICDGEFSVDSISSPKKYCGPACRGESLRLDKVRPGQGRGPKGQPPGACIDCGATLAKRSFVRCQSCWKIARSLGQS